MEPRPQVHRSLSTSSAPNEAYKKHAHMRNFSRPNSFRADNVVITTRPSNVESLILRKSLAIHMDSPKRNTHHLSALTGPDNFAPVQRWDGIARTTQTWNALKRDKELYDQSGDVNIHLHHNATHQSGPSFRVSREAIIDAGCGSLLKLHSMEDSPMSSEMPSPQRSPGSPSSLDSGYSSAGSHDRPTDLFFPVPWMLSRDEALTYHLTTRNMFAWIMDKPLVGDSLGQAMINLLERMLVVRSATVSSLDDCVSYFERMGYMDMANHPPHALAVLAFAEHAGCEQTQRDAFIHCVGMSDVLDDTDELSLISKATRIAILDAANTMRTRVDRVLALVPTFFERDTSSARLGLTPSQRMHLERFRSFLTSFYVSKFGYWPPPDVTKSICQAIHDDFESLYELLAHRHDAFAPTTTPGGLCVLQNVDHFDSLHFFTPLPSSLPLLPTLETQQKSLFRSSVSKKTLQARATIALAAAVNPIHHTPIASAYLRFERDALATQPNDLSATDARKVRWLCIYFTLQRLRSITISTLTNPAPQAAYYTCVPPPAPPPIKPKSALRIHPAFRNSLSSTAEEYAVQPDCANDPYHAPFPAPLRIPRRMSSRRAASLSTPVRQKEEVRIRASSAPSYRFRDGERGSVVAFAAKLRERCESRASTHSAASMYSGSAYSSHRGSVHSQRGSVYSLQSNGSWASVSTYRLSEGSSYDEQEEECGTPETPLTPEMVYTASGGSWYCDTAQV